MYRTWQLNHHSFCNCLRDIAMATNFRGTIGIATFTWHAGIFQNKLEYRTANGHVKSAVNQEFTRLECVQQASSSITASLSTFSSSGSAMNCIDKIFGIFCYYLLVGDTIRQGRLYARLCHTFLVCICGQTTELPVTTVSIITKCRTLHLTRWHFPNQIRISHCQWAR